MLRYDLREFKLISLKHRYYVVRAAILRKIARFISPIHEWRKCDEKRVETLFQVFLKRKPSVEDLNYYVKVLKKAKGDVMHVVPSFLESEEFAFLVESGLDLNLTLKNLYRKLLPKTQGAGNPLITWNKPPLIFLHFLKTGGSTMNAWLRQYFHPLQICPPLVNWKDKNLWKRGTIHGFDCTSEEFLDYKLFINHMDFIEIGQLSRQEKWIITLLREPKKRVYSYYHFIKAYRAEYDYIPTIKTVRTHNLKDFLKLPGEKKNLYDNYYLRSLTGYWVDASGQDPLKDNPKKCLMLAKKNLSQMKAVGILEEFQTSIHLFSKVLHLGNVDPQDIKPMNILSERLENPDDLIFFEKIQYETLDDETNDLLNQCTQYDQILYQYAQEIFARQCAETGIKE